MINRKPYISPVINIEEFAMQANVAESGNSGEHGDPKNGNAGNNQECWTQNLYEGFIYDYGPQTYVCMPEYTAPVPT